MARILPALAVGLALAFPAHAQRNPRDEQVVYPPCREVRSLDAMQYWFWDAYFGHVDVHDFTHERWGRLGVDPSICFRIALVVVENTELKTAGYRQAVSELLQWVVDDPDDDAERTVRQLERITGESFDTRAEWISWWEQSEPFVMWSPSEERLVVMTEAQEAGESVHANALRLDAEEYWFYAARGWISDAEPVGEYVFGEVLIPPHGYNFRVAAAELQDSSAKERGYRRALDNLFVDGVLLPDVGAGSLERLMERIASLTDQTHASRDEWISWWNENRDRLVLAPDGERLIVR